MLPYAGSLLFHSCRYVQVYFLKIANSILSWDENAFWFCNFSVLLACNLSKICFIIKIIGITRLDDSITKTGKLYLHLDTKIINKGTGWRQFSVKFLTKTKKPLLSSTGRNLCYHRFHNGFWYKSVLPLWAFNCLYYFYS